MFEKIVVGLDGSEISERGLEMACDLAEKYGSQLHLVHTPQPKTVAFALGGISGYRTATSMPSHDQVALAAAKILDKGKAIAEARGQQIAGTHAEEGDPAHEITEYAKRNDAGLIVTGRRGLGSLGALVQGSTSQKINHLAKCACLSVV